MTSVTQNLDSVHRRITAAALQAGRDPAGIRLIAVSKRHAVERIEEAWAAGQREFGENVVQEAAPKIEQIGPRDGLVWHFIGSLQRNKTRTAARLFDWVHCIDRQLIAERLSEQRPAGAPPLNVCLQVEVAGREGRAGVDPAALEPLAMAVARLPRLRLRGLMCLPPPAEDPAVQRGYFRRLRECMMRLNSSGLALDTLSAGMTGDLEAAIAEGATHLRVGTAVFGERPA